MYVNAQNRPAIGITLIQVLRAAIAMSLRVMPAAWLALLPADS